MNNLIPPTELLMDGSTTQEEYRSTGEGFVNTLLIGRAGLKPSEKVLDVGFGIGQKARVLASYLDGGTYDGFDVVKSVVEWCIDHYRDYPNFKFLHSDIYSSHFNPDGPLKASNYIFPYSDNYFDLVFLSSVFTHMLPLDMDHYISEIARVLKPGGRCVSTYFLLNEEARDCMKKELNTIKIPHVYKTASCQVADLNNPEMTVAHDEDLVKHLYFSIGMNICEIYYGYWCGRKELLNALQDIIIAVKNDYSPMKVKDGANAFNYSVSPLKRIIRKFFGEGK